MALRIFFSNYFALFKYLFYICSVLKIVVDYPTEQALFAHIVGFFISPTAWRLPYVDNFALSGYHL